MKHRVISLFKRGKLEVLRWVSHGYRWIRGADLKRVVEVTPSLFVGGQIRSSRLATLL